MRQRMIKPEFFSSESMADCSPMARLCFIGLWCCADDEGRMRFQPRALRKDIFGLDEVSIEDIVGYLVELENVGCIAFYTDGQDVVLSIPNFLTYQTINRPSKSNVPDVKGMAHVLLSECSVSAHPKELIKELINSRGERACAEAQRTLSYDDWMANYKEAN